MTVTPIFKKGVGLVDEVTGIIIAPYTEHLLNLCAKEDNTSVRVVIDTLLEQLGSKDYVIRVCGNDNHTSELLPNNVSCKCGGNYYKSFKAHTQSSGSL